MHFSSASSIQGRRSLQILQLECHLWWHLAQPIEAIEGNAVILSGVDLADGTPVIDMKPYLLYFDFISSATVPNWVKVFSKDSDRQNAMPSPKARYAETGKQMKERSSLRVTGGEADEFVAGNEGRRDTTKHNASQVIAPKVDRGTKSTNSMLDKSNSMSKTVGNMADESGPKKVVEIDIEMEDPKKLISSISNAEWTDEQLLELDCLDDMMC